MALRITRRISACVNFSGTIIAMSRVIAGYRSSSRNFFADPPLSKRRSAFSSATSTEPGALDLLATSCPPKPIRSSPEQMSTASAKSGNFPGRNDRFGTTHSSAPFRSNKSRLRLVCDRQFGALATFPHSKIPRCRSSFPDGGMNTRPISKMETLSAPARMFRSSTSSKPLIKFGRSAT